jgi:SAM-dependent methyltransferase
VPQNVFVGPVAQLYDAAEQLNSRPAAVDAAVWFLAESAGDGSALEFAIGTGRIALPLRALGIDVHGIEISDDMIAELRRKPDGDNVPVVVGDMATSRAPDAGSYALVYLVYNTVSNLLDQSEQIACFENAAAHLRPGGAFVIELEVPQVRRVPPGQSSFAFDVAPEHLGFDTYDFAAQRLVPHHYSPRPDGRMATFASHHRSVWPAELDLMARIAGMTLRERWGDWSRAPFTGESSPARSTPHFTQFLLQLSRCRTIRGRRRSRS